MSDLIEDMADKAASALAHKYVGTYPAPFAVVTNLRRLISEALSIALAGRVVEPPTREQVWAVIADIRDAAPRSENDASTDEIVDALVDRGYLCLTVRDDANGQDPDPGSGT